ncbi:rab15 effector protein [Esox lucius]|uniref:Sb:cb470 n=1 Tax=Esox lucius TaxID=8010 RepID=A0AAY5K2W6_ESOLU|nr:rab15 effector protein [Esox lucius]
MGKVESKHPDPDIPKIIAAWWKTIEKKPQRPTLIIPNVHFTFPTLWGSRGDSPPTPDYSPTVFSTLWRTHETPNNFVPHFSDSVGRAAARTQEYLLFVDPEGKFKPSPAALGEVFLMTYVSRSSHLHMTDSFNCTAMTKQQRVLLGADWVWAVLERPTKNPCIQIAVQILHLSENDRGLAEEHPEVCAESMEMAKMESANRNKAERMVDFCASVGRDCYALFLLFGRKGDPGNIYGVLSNNFSAATGRTKINRALIENFFKGSRYLHTPAGMLQAIITKRPGDPLTLLIKFT